MKRVKIMLMTIVLLAVVGGALAFKARYNRQLCYTTPDEAGSCPATQACIQLNAVTTTTQPTHGITLCTTPKQAGVPCNQHICTTLFTIKND